MNDRNPMPLYQQILGSDWDALPASIRAMHTLQGRLEARGLARVERGTGLLARLSAWLNGFPEAGENVPVTVRFELAEGVECWQRDFGGKRFTSYQSAGKGSGKDKLLNERFGPITFGIALQLDQGKLRLIMRRWRFCGVPLPMFLAPGGDTYEHVEDGRFCFHVEINQPGIGMIVRYRGWLELNSGTGA
ncbi:MAG: DUF4166 domain-containing protein [Burkholderiaceae bacterium]|nr:DUF4166 domain-containing protein [Burkholderiaceae bacterium]